MGTYADKILRIIRLIMREW